MRRLGLALVLVISLVAVSLTAQRPPALPDVKPTVILISFDGFRWDYPAKAPTPNLHRLITRGVQAQNLIPSFPSKTFPNHYSIVTGLYPGHHGVVANNIWDPTTGRAFTTSNREAVGDSIWWGGEPIWVTAEKIRQATAAFFWPGSEAPIEGVRPHFWQSYNDKVPGTDRVDQVLAWLDLPTAGRPTFLTLYFEDTDAAGHDQGPDSDAVRAAIVRDDQYIGRLIRGLEQRGLFDRVNIVVVSDHGMAETSNDRVVVVDEYISLDDVKISDINPLLAIFPNPGKADAVYRALVNANPHLKVYRREDTPERWHYRDHPRIPPILGVADEGWQVLRRATVNDVAAGKLRGDRGNHGYDPILMSMRGVFVAAGPAFKSGVTVPAFENVNIYNALARILDVTPAKNDGNPAVAKSLLR